MSGNYNRKKIALAGALMFMVTSVSAQTVKGVVTDNTGEPIIGASVMEVGVAGNGGVTDIDGNFTVNLKGKSKKLKISYNTVYCSLHRAEQTGSNQNRKRSGRPQCTAEHEDKYIRVSSLKKKTPHRSSAGSFIK